MIVKCFFGSSALLVENQLEVGNAQGERPLDGGDAVGRGHRDQRPSQLQPSRPLRPVGHAPGLGPAQAVGAVEDGHDVPVGVRSLQGPRTGGHVARLGCGSRRLRRARGGPRARAFLQASREVRRPGLGRLMLHRQDGGDPEQAGQDHGNRNRPRQHPGGGVEAARGAPDEGIEASRGKDRDRNPRERRPNLGPRLGHAGPSRMGLWADHGQASKRTRNYLSAGDSRNPRGRDPVEFPADPPAAFATGRQASTGHRAAAAPPALRVEWR